MNFEVVFTSTPPAIVVDRAWVWRGLRSDLEKFVSKSDEPFMIVKGFKTTKHASGGQAAFHSWMAARFKDKGNRPTIKTRKYQEEDKSYSLVLSHLDRM